MREKPSERIDIAPIPERIPVAEIPCVEILAMTGRNCIVRTVTTKRNTKNERYTITV
jgi:hypothetical protein